MQLSNGFNIGRVGSAVILQFTRPEIRNSLSVHVMDALIDTVAGLDRNVSALIFTGSDGVFASGADLREISAVSAEKAAEFAQRGQRLTNLIEAVDAKTVAVVNGYCYGGALDMALACNSRIGSPNAEFCHPGGGLGIMTGWGGTQRLPRLVGEAAALEIFLTGKKVSAVEALKVGLIDQVAEDPLQAAIQAYL